MLMTPIGRRMAAYGLALTIAFSLPLSVPAQQSPNTANGIISGSADDRLIARDRGGGARGGGGARVNRSAGGGGFSGMRSSGGMSRPSGGIRPSFNRPSPGISRQGSQGIGQQMQHLQAGNRGANAIQSRPMQPIAGQGQRPNTGQQPINPRFSSGPGQLPTQLPPQQGNLPNRPNRPPNDVNVSHSVNVEGYDGGWGYQGQYYPWGMGAAAGLTGFAIGSMRNTLPANSQPMVIQGQPYYESSGMYFAPQSNGSYQVVPPPSGAVETQLPSEAKSVQVGKQTLYEVQGVYYQPTIQNGKQVYMVVTP